MADQDITPILDPLGVPRQLKHDAFDAFHAATDPSDFQRRFDTMALPRETKHALFEAKFANQPSDTAPGPPPTRVSPPQGFWSRYGQMMNPLNIIAPKEGTPWDLAKAIFSPDPTKWNEAANAATPGRASLSLLESLPVVGGLAKQVEQDLLVDKNPKAVLGTAAAMATPGLLGNVLKGRVPVKNSLNPVEQSAVNYGEREGIPIDIGTATGSPFLRAAQETVAKQPFLSSRAEVYRNASEEGVANAGSRLSRSISPAGTGDVVQAGEGVGGTIRSRIDYLHDQADKAYGELRNIAHQNVRKVQVGSRPSQVVDASGKPVMVPVYEDMAMPVGMSQLKSTVAPILDRLERTIPEAQKQASPGIGALRQIMLRGDNIDINTAIQDLSSIQNIARLAPNELQAVRGVSKGLAATAVPQFRAAIDQAVGSGGADAIAALNRGRALTTAKYQAHDVLKRLPTEPGALVKRLTRNDDSGINLLRSVNALAPAEMPNVGRSFVEGLVDDMTYQGDVRRAQSAVRSWHNMGDETKSLLFPDPKIRQNVTDFFNLSEMLGRRANPSGTGPTFAAVLAALNPKVLAAELVAGKPLVDALFNAQGPALARSGIPFNIGPVVSAPLKGIARVNLLTPPESRPIPPPPQ